MTIYHLAQVPIDEDDFFGIVSLNCGGIWDGIEAGSPDGDLQCDGIFTVNTEDVKRAKQDFSSIAFTGLAPLDVTPLGADLGQATGLVITGTNGAWGKSDNIRGITFTALTGSVVPGGVFEVEIEYKTRGFNPV